MKLSYCSWLLLIALLFSTNKAEAAIIKQTLHTTVELSAVENDKNINVRLDIKPRHGWQIYSHTPGEVGLPTDVEWKLHNHKLLDEEWSDGEDIIYEGFGLNVYRRPAFYKAVISKALGKMPELEISWMACKGECVPESLSFELTPQAFLGNIVTPASSSANSASLPSQESESYGWVKIMLLAFVGGLILNFMPCVFPILFIKIMSIARQSDKRRNLHDALLYMAGVLSCFILMAALLWLLKMQGSHIGWGFQLQSPYFVGAMALLFLVLALMFLNVIKVNWSLRYMPAGSFMTGLLAVLIASPCTAPFMGAAVGWALTSERSPLFYYPVFLALGFGYALPFFLAGIFPGVLQRVLPKPGKWMDILKKFFALPMLATSAWLLWVLCGGSSIYQGGWSEYQPQKVEELVQKGDKVLVNFTAKWCITCLVNEKSVFSSEEFTSLMKEHRVKLLKADWTDHDASIAEALAKYGRSSIPLYVYYNGSKNYVLLPQLLTIDDIKKVLNSDDAAAQN